MRKSSFTDSQIMENLKGANAGIKVACLCRELGSGSTLFYGWRSTYGGIDVSLIAKVR